MIRAFTMTSILLLVWQHGASAESLDVVAVRSEGIENLFRVSQRLYSGSRPAGEAGFATLRQLGVKTIISVDGAAPDVKLARERGMRYVHLPIGYDGVKGQQAARIIKAVSTLPAPIFLHCHHGKHRGPAAVAISNIATENWTAAQAIAWLERAGTSPKYALLYKQVATFQPPAAADLAKVPNEFPEKARVSTLVHTMIEIEQRWENLAAIQNAGFQPPTGHPDLDPPHEARLLHELFFELNRTGSKQYGTPVFRKELASAIRTSRELELALEAFKAEPTSTNQRVVRTAFQRTSESCSRCHAHSRNGAK